MHIAEIRIEDPDFAAEMSRMRVWLDSRRLEPASFRYQHGAGGVVVWIDFTVQSEAAAFADEFSGRVLS